MPSNAVVDVSKTLAASAVSYAAAAATAAARPVPPAKYVPVHRRNDGGDARSQRSASPTPSEASTSTLVSSTSPSTKPRVYSIATLLHLSHDPEIKVISLEQKERLKQVLPEVVMNRKMRKAMEYHAIQERVRAKAQAQAQRNNTTNSPSKKSNDAHSQPASGKPEKQQQQQQQRQRPGQRRPSRAGAERRRNASKVVDEASWRTLRLPPVSAV